MTGPIVYMDTSEVLEGKLDELKAVMRELVDFVEANEPVILSYNVYFDPEGLQMTVIHVHRNQASLEFHLQVAGHLFPKAGQFLRLKGIHVYGEIEAELLHRLQQKAEMLGQGSVEVDHLHAGFLRHP